MMILHLQVKMMLFETGFERQGFTNGTNTNVLLFADVQKKDLKNQPKENILESFSDRTQVRFTVCLHGVRQPLF